MKYETVFKHVVNRTAYQNLMFTYFSLYDGFAKYCPKRIVFVQNRNFRNYFLQDM